MNHPESTCQKCGGPNIAWFAPSEIWNAAHEEFGVLCPICFVALAEKVGHDKDAWIIQPEFYAEPQRQLLETQQVAIERGNDLLAMQAASIAALEKFACPKRGWTGCFCEHCTLRRLVTRPSQGRVTP